LLRYNVLIPDYFPKVTSNIEEIKKFIFNSHLINLFINNLIKNLKDYALGIEIGLDIYTHKNRGGQLMEKTIENLLIKYNIEYQKQKINFLWIGDDKGLKKSKNILKEIFFNTKNFLFTIETFEEWLKIIM